MYNLKSQIKIGLIVTFLLLISLLSFFVLGGSVGGLNVVCENRSYTYDTTAPTVTLLNLTLLNSSSNSVNVYFNLKDLSSNLNCSIYLNRSYNGSSYKPNITYNYLSTESLNSGHYGCTINCSDGSGNLGNSTFLTINISESLNLNPNATWNSPLQDSKIRGSGFRINVTLIDNDLDTLSYKTFLSITKGTTNFDVIDSGSGLSNGSYVESPTESFRNGTFVRLKVEVDDGTIKVNSSERNVTISTVKLTLPSTYFQRPTIVNITGNNTWKINLRWAIGWNYSGNITDYNYSFSKQLIYGADNISVYQESSSSNVSVLNHSSSNFTFMSYNITPSCSPNIYHIDFNVNLLRSTDFLNMCDGYNCNMSLNVTHNESFQLKDIDIVIPSSSLANWNSRRSIDVSYLNYTLQAETVALGDVYCLIGEGGGGLGIFDNTTYVGNNQTGTNETPANSSTFSGALTDINNVFNPTISADDDGITLRGLKVSGGYRLVFDYTWSDAVSGTSYKPSPSSAGGGGGILTVTEIIGNISVNPRRIDAIPFIKFPFGKNVATQKIEVNPLPDLCVFENNEEQFKCIIDSSGLVVIEYTSNKNVLSDFVSDRLIIGSGTSRAYVPVSFRLFNLDYYVSFGDTYISSIPYTPTYEMFFSYKNNQVNGIKVFTWLFSIILILSFTATGKSLWSKVKKKVQ